MLCVVSAADHFYLSVSIIGPALSTESRPNNASSRRERRRKSVIFIFIQQQTPLLEPRCGCDGGGVGSLIRSR